MGEHGAPPVSNQPRREGNHVRRDPVLGGYVRWRGRPRYGRAGAARGHGRVGRAPGESAASRAVPRPPALLMGRILGKGAETVAYLIAVNALVGQWHWVFSTGWPLLAAYLGR